MKIFQKKKEAELLSLLLFAQVNTHSGTEGFHYIQAKCNI